MCILMLDCRADLAVSSMCSLQLIDASLRYIKIHFFNRADRSFKRAGKSCGNERPRLVIIDLIISVLNYGDSRGDHYRAAIDEFPAQLCKYFYLFIHDELHAGSI